MFRRSLSKALSVEQKYGPDEFFQSLQSYLDNEGALRQCLMPIIIEDSTISSQ